MHFTQTLVSITTTQKKGTEECTSTVPSNLRRTSCPIWNINTIKVNLKKKSAFSIPNYEMKGFHSPTERMFAERKWQQFPSWRMDSSFCVKSPATDLGEVRAISSFQSSLATVLAPSQTKHFSRDICRKFQSSNENIQGKATISGCCCFACFGSASECLLWNSTFRRLSWFNSFDTYSAHWTTGFAVSVWRKKPRSSGLTGWMSGPFPGEQELQTFHVSSQCFLHVATLEKTFFKQWKLL